MEAKLTFVRADDGHYHQVWIEPDDGRTAVLRLHVQHDLRHLVVESVLQLDDGLWPSLIATGSYPELTDGHVIAKTLTNAIVHSWRFGPETADGVRAHATSFRRPQLAARNSHDPDAVQRRLDLATARLADLDDETVTVAIEALRAVLQMWESTAPGAVMRLEWPLFLPGRS